MNTLSTRFAPTHDAMTRVAALAARWISAVDAFLADTLENSRRSEHERYLSRATNVYELERLERQWERRHLDTWTAL
jgi:hypothetical protein